MIAGLERPSISPQMGWGKYSLLWWRPEPGMEDSNKYISYYTKQFLGDLHSNSDLNANCTLGDNIWILNANIRILNCTCKYLNIKLHTRWQYLVRVLVAGPFPTNWWDLSILVHFTKILVSYFDSFQLKQSVSHKLVRFISLPISINVGPFTKC